MRGALGGVLMGLANLVPGISGGTMLLAAGVYTDFVGAIAELTVFRFRLRSIVMLLAVAVSAGLAILLLAGTVRELVIHQRWIMYSLFIGLTFGGLPLIWRLARPINLGVVLGSLVGFGVMVAMTLGLGQGGAAEEPGFVFLLFAGVIGASAMVLPGISGGYMLLVLGVYESILGAIDQFKTGLLGSPSQGTGPNLDVALGALKIVVPVGLGVVLGIAGISHLLKWLLEHYRKPTLGVLLGLVAGAVIGIWPFQRGVEPHEGTMYKGKPLTAEKAAALKPEKWPMEYFPPSAQQVLVSVFLIGVGYVTTQAVDALGRKLQGGEAAAV
ncbi:MAG: DUF368 domain-containing protein [Thermoanaerobaculia bacterium]|nr:DUF368 domain-containing protein [Thermoanaerobaculia bacterium]